MYILLTPANNPHILRGLLYWKIDWKIREYLSIVEFKLNLLIKYRLCNHKG